MSSNLSSSLSSSPNSSSKIENFHPRRDTGAENKAPEVTGGYFIDESTTKAENDHLRASGGVVNNSVMASDGAVNDSVMASDGVVSDSDNANQKKTNRKSGRKSKIEISETESNDGEQATFDFESDEWLDHVPKNPKRMSLSMKALLFHSLDAKGRPTGVVDARIYRYITHTQNIFVCGEIPYIYKGGYYRADTNKGAMLKSIISDCILEQYIRSTTIDRIYRLFLQRSELVKYPEELNDHSGYYINFKNGMYDVIRQRMYDHSPKILSVNQIPWDYHPNADHGSGTEIENFLKYAVPDEDDREMLLEYAGLCMTIDTDQQKMLVICGNGGTGKSTVINLIQDMVGKQNVSNVAMSKLSKDFQAIRMMGKLLNSCADLEIDALDDVTTIKKLIGEDAISDSYKGKDVISFDNYAKLLFSTNELPLVRNEKTEGFYRRLLVLTMNEKPEKKDPNLKKKLRAEMPYLIDLCMKALKRMYDRGAILVSEHSQEQTKQLRIDSDTVAAFLDACCVEDPKGKTPRATLFDKYTEYCKEWERQPHQKMNFFKALRNKGFRETKYSGNVVFYGIVLKDDSDEFMQVPDGLGDVPFPE